MRKTYDIIILGLIITGLIIAWGLGFAHGKDYWKAKYEWINEELRIDITNCRTTLNQCKRDLDNPEHCLSVCVEEFEKYGC